MKKLALTILALAIGFVAGARFVPGFWGAMPEAVRVAIPAPLHDLLNVPKAVAAKSGEAPQAGPGGGGRGGAGGGRGGAGGAGGGGRPTPVTVAQVQRKTIPMRVDTIGSVQAIASVTVRSRVDSQLEQLFFADGATVQKGEVLAKIDSRAIEAQIKQAEANLAKNRAALALARSTLKRGEDLASQDFASKQRLDENRSNVAVQDAQVKADEAQLELLRTQLTYYTIRAPISGKAGLANIKPGNMARSSDGAIAITTINQMSPIYVSFFLPQRHFQELREAIDRGDNKVEAIPQGGTKSIMGKLSLIENTMDNTSGTIGVRAMFDNPAELLWPGLIANVKVTFREEKDVVVVPREAVQMSQRGNFVFLVVDGVAKMQPVTVARSVDRDTVITSGLKGTETVIIDGQLLVVEGAKVQARQPVSSALVPEKTPSQL